MVRTLVLVALGAVVALASGGAGSSAPLAAPSLAVEWAEPDVVTSAGKFVAVERVAAPVDGARDTWRMNLDVALRNTGTTDLLLSKITVAYTPSAIAGHSTAYTIRDPNALLRAGAVTSVEVPEDRVFGFPLPPKVVVAFYVRGSTTPVTLTRTLVEWRGQTYLFPGRREDLPDGFAWEGGQNHVWGSKHRASDDERFAYDFHVVRWDGAGWTTKRRTRDGGTEDGKQNADFLIYDLPIYAMADGWVVTCRDGYPQNPVGEKLGKGNGLWIEHATPAGERVLYAHMQTNSIPRHLCPTQGNGPRQGDFPVGSVPVRAGEPIGRACNSGSSGGPHLHVQLYYEESTGTQGYPIHFRDVRTRFGGEDLKSAAPCDTANQRTARVTGAAIGKGQLVLPLYGRDHAELTRITVRDECFQDLLDTVPADTYAPAWLDGYDVGGTTYLNVVFRRATVPWTLRFGLTEDAYQTEIEKAVAAGYRPTHVESYLRGGKPRYAFVAEKSPGGDYRAYHGLTRAQHEQLADELVERGLMPVAVSVVSVNGTLDYTALWQKAGRGTWRLDSRIRGADYQAWVEQQAAAGRRLVALNAYTHEGRTWFAAVASAAASPAYRASHGLTAGEVEQQGEALVAKGYRTRVVTGYAAGAGTRYAALWR